MKIIKVSLIQVEIISAYSLSKNWAGKILPIIRASNTMQKKKSMHRLLLFFFPLQIIPILCSMFVSMILTTASFPLNIYKLPRKITMPVSGRTSWLTHHCLYNCTNRDYLQIFITRCWGFTSPKLFTSTLPKQGCSFSLFPPPLFKWKQNEIEGEEGKNEKLKSAE